MEFDISILLTSAVIGALISSIANIVISLTNRYHIRKIDNKKEWNAICEYRYKRLYDIWFNWRQFTSFDSDSPENRKLNESQIAYRRIFSGFFDDEKRYESIKPLFDSSVNVEKIEQLISQGDEMLANELILARDEQGHPLRDFNAISKKKFVKIATELSIELKKIVNEQLDELLKGNYINN